MAKLFKDYTQDQCYLFPPNLNELIPENHLVRVVSDFIDQIDISSVINSYPGGGSSTYHPRMLLKVLVYAYVEKIYSGRRIAKALMENVNFMWLAGGNKADFRTINRFRGERIIGNIKSVFSSMIEYLIDSGYISFEKYFLDGTTIEANARRSSYVWKKNTNRHKNNLEENVKELFKKVDRITEAENAEYGDEDLEELGENVVINSETIREKIEKVNQLLNEEPKNREAKKAKRKLERDYLPRMEKYEEQLEILGERNSYSKTDPDATMMRVKPNLRDAVVKPAYNVQIGTEDQFFLGYSIHNNPVDIRVMGDHLEQVKDMVGKVPEILIAEAGYGSEENYHILEDEDILPVVKYRGYDKKRKTEKDKYKAENFIYDEESDSFTCPEGKQLYFDHEKEEERRTGYIVIRREYQCRDCGACPAKLLCSPNSKVGRCLTVSWEWERYKHQAKKILDSEEGEKLRKQRSCDVEAVFGMIKGNRQFRRFHVRGIKKVEAEMGIICIAHNILKTAAVI